MKSKKLLVWAFLGLSTIFLAACGQKAPELSFQETLAAYDKSSETIYKMVQVATTQDRLLQTQTKGTLTMDMGQGKGKLLLDTKNITNPQTKDTEGNLELALDADLESEVFGVPTNLDAKVGLKTLIKDYQIYLQLSELALKANEEVQQQFAFFTAMAEGFKQKWFLINESEIQAMLQGMGNPIGGLDDPNWYKSKPEYYTNPTKTSYAGQPAWKVDFNLPVLKEEIKKVVAEVAKQRITTTGELQAASEEAFQELIKEWNEKIDALVLENVDAYFVIYAEDHVKFVLKNIDILLPELKILVQQEATAKTDTGVITIMPTDLSVEEKVIVNFEIKEIGKGKYAFDFVFIGPKPNDKENIGVKGTVAFEVSDGGFAIKPDLTVTAAQNTFKLQWAYELNQIQEHTFTAPAEAQNLTDVLWGMFGFDPDGVGEEEMVTSDEEVVDQTIELEIPEQH